MAPEPAVLRGRLGRGVQRRDCPGWLDVVGARDGGQRLSAQRLCHGAACALFWAWLLLSSRGNVWPRIRRRLARLGQWPAVTARSSKTGARQNSIQAPRRRIRPLAVIATNAALAAARCPAPGDHGARRAWPGRMRPVHASDGRRYSCSRISTAGRARNRNLRPLEITRLGSSVAADVRGARHCARRLSRRFGGRNPILSRPIWSLACFFAEFQRSCSALKPTNGLIDPT